MASCNGSLTGTRNALELARVDRQNKTVAGPVCGRSRQDADQAAQVLRGREELSLPAYQELAIGMDSPGSNSRSKGFAMLPDHRVGRWVLGLLLVLCHALFWRKSRRSSRGSRRLSPVGALALPAHRRARLHAQHLRSGRRQRGCRRQPLPLSGGRRLQRHARRRRPGILYFARYNHWHGSPWHYEVDGTRHIVAETSTADPDRPVSRTRSSCRQELFPRPLAWTWADTRGADLCWVPIAVRALVSHGLLAHPLRHRLLHLPPVRSAARSSRARSVLGRHDAARRRRADTDRPAGTDLAPAGHSRGKQAGVREEVGTSRPCRPARAVDSASDSRRRRPCCGPLELDVPRDVRPWRSRAPGSASPGTTAHDLPSTLPSPSSFGTGTLYNRDGREYLVKAFPINVRYDGKRVHLACYFPMPFFRSARIELVGAETAAIPDVHWSVRYAPYQRPGQPRGVLPRHLRRPSLGRSPARTWSCSTPREVEGSDDWSGQLRRHLVHLLARGHTHHAGGRPALLLRRQPHAAGPGHRHRGVGRRRRLLGRAQHDAALRRPSRRRGRRPSRQERRGQDRVGLPLPARRPHALRQERADPAGTRRNERIDRALRDRDLLVRRSQPLAPQDRRAADRRRGQRAGAPLSFAGCLGALRDHLALRVGRRSPAMAKRFIRRTRTGDGRPRGRPSSR